MQVLIYLDNKRATIGAKRNALLRMAAGNFVTFIDDDDAVADDFAEVILRAIERTPEADCIVYDAWVTIDGGSGKRCRYGIELENRDLPDEYLRLPDQKCCFRRQVVSDVAFEETNWGEDFAWAEAIRPRLLVQTRIPQVLYFYRYDSKTSESGPIVQRSNAELAADRPEHRRVSSEFASPSISGENLPIIGFLHVALMPGWKEIVAEQLAKLHVSGLYAKTSRIYVGIVGPSREDFDFVDAKLEVGVWNPVLEVGEVPTLELLEQFCRENHALVYYMHTKGVSRSSEETRSWRRYMEYFLVMRHDDCLQRLRTHDVCGVNWHVTPLPHFSGNFWWSKSEYIRTLPGVREHIRACAQLPTPIVNWWSCEFWIGANPAVRAACLHESGVNHYQTDYHRSRYTELRDVVLTPAFDVMSAWRGLENRVQDLLEPVGPIRTVVEVGVEYGFSLFALASAIPHAKVIGVDCYDDVDPSEKLRLSTLGPQGVLGSQDAEAWVRKHLPEFPNVELVRDRSERLASRFANSIDVLHLDAVHTFDDLSRDFRLWEPLVRIGGCVLFHDIESFPDDVGRFFHSLPGRKAVISGGPGLGAWYKDEPVYRLDGRTRLSACLIVRDSADTLEACLTSICPWVDEVVVVDTGSIDNTVAIAEKCGARVCHFQWCDDFSAARNFSLAQANGMWLFWMDADDTISPENGCRLRALADSAPLDGPLGYVAQVRCPGREATVDATMVDHVKLVRNHPEIRFEGRIHEQVLTSIRRLGGEIAWTDIYVTHSGADQTPEGLQRKYERDLKLLYLDRDERPDHPFVWFNLGMTFADMGRHGEAIAALETCLDKSTPAESHVRKAYAILVSCLQQQQRFDTALEVCQRGRQLCPDDSELAFREGMLHHRACHYEKAIDCYQQALTPVDDRYLGSIDEGIRGPKSRHNLALVRMDQREFALAEEQWRLVLAAQMGSREAWIGLAECLLQQDKADELRMEIERLQQISILPEVACHLRALLAEHKGDVVRTRSELEAWAQQHPRDPELLRFRCQFLWQHGPRGEAIAALSKLHGEDPDVPAHATNLAAIFEQVACHQVAADLYQKSLTMNANCAAAYVSAARCLEHLGRGSEAVQLLASGYDRCSNDEPFKHFARDLFSRVVAGTLPFNVIWGGQELCRPLGEGGT